MLLTMLRPRKPRIAIDMDGMWVALFDKLLAWYNEEHGTSVKLCDAWTTRCVVDPERFVAKALDDYLVRDNVFADLELLDGFLDALPELQQLGGVWIASTPSRNPDSASDKIRHVLRHTNIDRRKICLLKDKWLLDVDIFFEDWPSNIINFRDERGPDKFIGSIAYPYNQSVESIVNLRANSYLDTRAAWETLVRGAREFVERHPLLDPKAERG